MALLDRVKYDAQSADEVVWKHPSDELRLGSQLIVNQSQEALLVKGGQALDVFGPGTHTLSTDNIPLVRKLVNLPFGGQTPFTAEVWYVNKTARRDIPWGTASRIPLFDKRLQFPIHVGAHGQWGFRVDDSRSFVTQLVGTQVGADSQKVYANFVGEIVQRLSNVLSVVLAEQPFFEVAQRLNDIAERVERDLRPAFARFGIEVVSFNLVGVNLPPEERQSIQAAYQKKMEMAAVGQSYQTIRAFDVLDKAASNEGGGGGLLAAGLGLGVGLGAAGPVGQKLGQALTEGVSPTGGGPAPAADPMARLKKLKDMLDAGVITTEDFERKKKEILDGV